MFRRLPAALAPVLALALAGAAGAPELLVTTGEVTATTAVVWVQSESGGEVAIEARPAGGEDAVTGLLRITRRNDSTGKLLLTGLTPATRYAWQVRAAGHTVKGEFVTAPAHDGAASVTFLWSGDLGGAGLCRPVDGGYRIFTTMARRRPDFFLFVGDTIYADRKCDAPGVVPGAAFVAETLAQYRSRHRYQRKDPAMQEFLRLTSVYAIWDDHEVKNDFAGPSEPLMPTGRRAFLEYWPILPPDEEPTRLYRKFRWGKLLEVFILDTRQYRSPNTDLDGPGKTMLGAAQRRWLVDNVSVSTAVWKVVVSSVSLSIPTGRPERRDSWSNAGPFGLPLEGGTGFAVERDAILRQLRERGVKNLVFIVADVHHAELIRHHPTPSFAFHEFVAGPLSASLGRPRPLDDGLNPRSLFARGGVNNFGEVTIEPARLTVRLIDEEGTVLFTHTIGPD
ncbi:MAG: alkaline phosphatase D family protein [Candidatus Rokubacteria bacterium]|nr:alkaline phosphatase D family protein [Candidatus Rokubacteria bacterium]